MTPQPLALLETDSAFRAATGGLCSPLEHATYLPTATCSFKFDGSLLQRSPGLDTDAVAIRLLEF
jgi:hypothetical protein